MRNVIKHTNTIVNACQLGQNTKLEQNLMNAGRLVRVSAEQYEVFSQEATGKHGEVAYVGDYIKLDTAGFPYPNKRNYFEKNHRKIGENEYEQIAQPLQAWCLGEPVDEAIEFLLQHKGLKFDLESEERCFSAPLWGTQLTAKQDAVLLIYRVNRNEDDTIADIEYNFVAREEFSKTYLWLD